MKEYTPYKGTFSGVRSILFQRFVKIAKSNSFFLFGARATGKSTLLKSSLPQDKTLHIDLLLPELEEHYARHPERLIGELNAAPSDVEWVVLDEVQKVPKLLDVVHHLLENNPRKFRFAMIGSSGRKLKRGSANLLGGRAFVCDLFPLTHNELGNQFVLDDVLNWGSLPILYQFSTPSEKMNFLSSYVRLYLSEEIQKEQLVRNLDPFRHFLEVSSQYNGKIINYASVSKEIGVDPKTVASYYQILEETLLGSFLLPFSHSFRKKLLKSPKFYFFDTGVARAMARHLTIPVLPSTSYYGEIFERFIYCQLKSLCNYAQNDFRISYYHDENGIEIDFVIERPGKRLLFVEVKSATDVYESMTKNLRTAAKDFPNAEFQLWSQDSAPNQIGQVNCMPWHTALERLLSGD